MQYAPHCAAEQTAPCMGRATAAFPLCLCQSAAGAAVVPPPVDSGEIVRVALQTRGDLCDERRADWAVRLQEAHLDHEVHIAALVIIGGGRVGAHGGRPLARLRRLQRDVLPDG